jgi:hypothetical protein
VSFSRVLIPNTSHEEQRQGTRSGAANPAATSAAVHRRSQQTGAKQEACHFDNVSVIDKWDQVNVATRVVSVQALACKRKRSSFHLQKESS